MHKQFKVEVEQSSVHPKLLLYVNSESRNLFWLSYYRSWKVEAISSLIVLLFIRHIVHLFFYRQTVWICTPIGVGYGISVLFDGSWVRNFFLFFDEMGEKLYFYYYHLFLTRWVRSFWSAMSTSPKLIKQGIKTTY